jgi:hypothetical protein
MLGFGLVSRAVAGFVLLGASINSRLVLCTFLTTLVLGTAKRRAELDSVENGEDVRQYLEDYSGELLQVMFMTPFALYDAFRDEYLTTEGA